MMFYEKLDTLFDYTEGYQFTYSHDVIEAVKSREEQIKDHYDSRQQAIETKIDGGTPYKPVDPENIYLTALEIEQRLTVLSAVALSPYDQPPTSTMQVLDAKGKSGRSFAVERTAGQNVFDAVAQHVKDVTNSDRKVLIAAWSEGSKDRFSQVLVEHGSADLVAVETYEAFNASKSKLPHIAVLPLEEGFETPEFAVIAEQDVLGDRLVRRTSKRKRDKDFIAEASSLAEGDIVVHVDHGIAKFIGLRTIEAAGAPHDCLELRYAGDDKLFLPVENIELLSRYGNADSEVALDKLGGVAWQSRKAKLKKRLLEMADQLIKIAAERALKTAMICLLAHQWTGLFVEMLDLVKPKLPFVPLLWLSWVVSRPQSLCPPHCSRDSILKPLQSALKVFRSISVTLQGWLAIRNCQRSKKVLQMAQWILWLAPMRYLETQLSLIALDFW